MVPMLVIALQSAAVAGPPDTAPARPSVPSRCPPQAPGDDIVVCARAADADRLTPLPEKYAQRTGVPKAEVGILGNAKLVAEVEQGADAQGGAINRAMVRLRLPF